MISREVQECFKPSLIDKNINDLCELARGWQYWLEDAAIDITIINDVFKLKAYVLRKKVVKLIDWAEKKEVREKELNWMIRKVIFMKEKYFNLK